MERKDRKNGMSDRFQKAKIAIFTEFLVILQYNSSYEASFFTTYATIYD